MRDVAKEWTTLGPEKVGSEHEPYSHSGKRLHEVVREHVEKRKAENRDEAAGTGGGSATDPVKVAGEHVDIGAANTLILTVIRVVPIITSATHILEGVKKDRRRPEYEADVASADP